MAGSLTNRSIYSELLRTERFVDVKDCSKSNSRINFWV